MLYEQDNEHILLRVIFKNVAGYYNVYNESKKMNFSVNNEPYDKLIGILDHIHEKLEITFSDFAFEQKGEEYFSVKVSNETCFKNKTLKLL